MYNICTTSAQRLRRWSDIVQMLYKCFVFIGMVCVSGYVGFVYSVADGIQIDQDLDQTAPAIIRDCQPTSTGGGKPLSMMS